MIWLNKYHRGFNRLWLVFTCFPFFIFLLYVLLSEDYKANRYVEYDRRVTNYWSSSGNSDRSWNYGEEKSEDIIAAWVQEQWRKDKPWKGEITTEQKVRTPARTSNSRSATEQKVIKDLSNHPLPNYFQQARDKLEQERAQKSLTPEDRFKRSIVRSVRLMKEAKSFTDKELTTIIGLAVEADKTYPSRAWKPRWRAAGHLLVGFIVFIAIFGFGHGVFCLIVWIIRGFRESQ